jgi:hypothetical protein
MDPESEFEGFASCRGLREVLAGDRPLVETSLWWAEGHWLNCPSCQQEFPSAKSDIGVIRMQWREDSRINLNRFRNEFLSKQHTLLAGASLDRRDNWAVSKLKSDQVYASILLHLADYGGDVSDELGYIAECGDPCFHVYIDADDPFNVESLEVSQSCSDFIRELPREVASFVFLARVSFELFSTLTLEARTELAESHALSTAEGKEYIANASKMLERSGLNVWQLYTTVEIAAESLLKSYLEKNPSKSSITPKRQEEPGPGLDAVVKDLKLDLCDFGDSLKAGQMEVIRLLERKDLGTEQYEENVKQQLGSALYERLHERTQRGLKVSEYLYRQVNVPECLFAAILAMSNAYENEILQRVFWPVIEQLFAAGIQTYDAAGRSDKPLIRDGKCCRANLNIGSLAWYLANDADLRERISERGFDTDAISQDARFVRKVRNPAAHDEPVADRAMADDLRRRMLAANGILGRLHPPSASAAPAR